MTPVFFISIAIITVLGPFILSVAWHKSYLRSIVLSRLCRLLGISVPDYLGVDEFDIWWESKWPWPDYKRGVMVLCPFCTAPYFAALFAALHFAIAGPHATHQTDAILMSIALAFIAVKLIYDSNLRAGTYPIQRVNAMVSLRPDDVTAEKSPTEPGVARVNDGEGPTSRLTSYMKLAQHDQVRVRTSNRELWNQTLGFTSTQNEDGGVTLSSVDHADKHKQAQFLSVFSSTRDAATLQLRALQSDYRRDIAWFKASGVCQACSPESHVQHLYYAEVIAAHSTET